MNDIIILMNQVTNKSLNYYLFTSETNEDKFYDKINSVSCNQFTHHTKSVFFSFVFSGMLKKFSEFD